jgi:hypothetical protein
MKRHPLSRIAPLALAASIPFPGCASAPPRFAEEAPWEALTRDFAESMPLAAEASLSPDDPLAPACAEAIAALEETPFSAACGVVSRVAAAGGLPAAAVLRLQGEGPGWIELYLLALEDGPGWRLALTLADASYAGIAGWSRSADVSPVVSEAGAITVEVRTLYEDTDMGTNAQMEERDGSLALCAPSAPGAPLACGQLATFGVRSLTALFADEPPPPPSYGPLGETVWTRRLAWRDGAVRVSPVTGALPPDAPRLPSDALTPAAFLAACRAPR